MNFLQAIDLNKKHGQRPVLINASFEIKSGEIVGLLGPNGAGKTTAFSIIVGLIEADGGKVLLNNEDLSPYPIFIRARKGLGFLSQGSSIFRGLTVEENLLLVFQNMPNGNLTEVNRERAHELLREFGLQELAQHRASQLSGGERRKLEIVRAMVREPKFLLLDEPFSELDPKSVADLQDIILKLREKGLGILLTDHRVREALRIIGKIYIINKGQIIAEGRPEEVLKKNEVREIYLGAEFRL
ncbi:MAG: LPS export ABC transporter ATP-binding protein [Candidatus Saccharicenans sp.]|nr:MAG: LPS export ABC transporter ATP-binding protein [Candidatus Aminicenantes bacterium]HEK85037.1 LPS export ABC transporter ATP-binding protein [Candidatus Aminicenantes bacterium]